MAKQKITVEGIKVSIDEDGFISLTDIAKGSSANKPAVTIQSWLRNQRTISFLATWEQVHNENLKVSQMTDFRDMAADNRSAITPKLYIETTGAIGMTSKNGRYGGIFAHSDIALEFCSWLSPEFKVYLIKEFQRLKADEQMLLGDPFNIKRHLTSGNYSLLVASILGQTDERLLTHPQPYKSRLPFASESDMLNKIVFGKTAKEWKQENTDKPADRNQRDYANIIDLVILNNLEFLDAMLLKWDMKKEDREKTLKEAYEFQYPILKRSKTLHKIQALSDKAIE